MEGGDQSLMATIDDKVVAMSFESSKFESGVNSSISAINKLKAALKFDGASQGLSNIDKAASGVQTGLLAKIGGAVYSYAICGPLVVFASPVNHETRCSEIEIVLFIFFSSFQVS